MAATITTSIITGGSNSHATTSAELNRVGTDFASQGVVGALTNTLGVAPSTGAFAVNAQGTPAMLVDVTAGNAWITATPSGQASQLLGVTMTASYTSYAISANASGSTKYDWIYLKVDPAKAGGTEDAAADDVTALYTSRSSSNTADNNAPPTYGILLAIVTVANGASSITNANIADSRTQAYISAAGSNGVNLETIRNEQAFDFVASGGCVWSGDSYGATLNGSMTAGVVYINGKRVPVSAVTAHAFTLNKDTYVDVDNAGTLHYSESTTNAASQALTSGYLRLAIIVSGAASIASVASVNQGQETKVVPIASSIPYAVTDSLGNLICPRDPQRKTLGYRQIIIDATSTSTSDMAGLNLTCIIPTGRKAKVSGFIGAGTASVASNAVGMVLVDVTASANIATANSDTNASGDAVSVNPVAISSAGGTRNYKAQIQKGANAATVHGNASSTNPNFILVELA